jgi:hypothetical protein
MVCEHNVCKRNFERMRNCTNNASYSIRNLNTLKDSVEPTNTEKTYSVFTLLAKWSMMFPDEPRPGPATHKLSGLLSKQPPSRFKVLVPVCTVNCLDNAYQTRTFVASLALFTVENTVCTEYVERQ